MHQVKDFPGGTLEKGEVMLTTEKLTELEKKFKKETGRSIPVKIRELATAPGSFLTQELIEAALKKSDDWPKKGPGQMKEADKPAYHAAWLTFFETLELDVAQLEEPEEPETIKQDSEASSMIESMESEVTNKEFEMTQLAEPEIIEQEPEAVPLMESEKANQEHELIKPIKFRLVATKTPTGRSVSAPSGMIRLTVNMPVELHRELRIQALREGTTVTEMVVSWARDRLKM
jgi:hypothetical protein